MEFGALVDVDDAVGGRFAVPNRIVQIALDPGQNHLEDREATTKPFAGQQVP